MPDPDDTPQDAFDEVDLGPHAEAAPEEEATWAAVDEAVERLLIRPDPPAYNALLRATQVEDDHPLYTTILRLASALVKAGSQQQFTPSPPPPPAPAPRSPDPEELHRRREQTLLDFWEALLPVFLETHRLQSRRQRRRGPQPEEFWRVLDAFLAAVGSWGFCPVGQVGQIAAYAPSRHRPASPELLLEEGDPVEVEMVGVERDGRVLRPALVRPA